MLIEEFLSPNTLQLASKNIGAHKPKAALGLSLKGISLYDEKTKVLIIPLILLVVL